MPGRAPSKPETITENWVSCSNPEQSGPVLLVVGDASEGGGLADGKRLVPFNHAVEIGRRPRPPMGVDVCCLDDARVSARHARVSGTRAGGFEVTDLGSKNGTLVEGRRITGPTKIADGALLFVGGHALVVRTLSAEALAAIHEDLARPFGPVPTISASMAANIRRLRRLAAAGDALLLSGETGVGKEVYARALHQASGRPGRFVALNCAALPVDLVESELFGFVRGAHSQAAAGKPGLIEEAERGTLFLDEIGDMPPAAQAKLLRFLQEHEYVPLGGREARRLDVRVVGATSSLGPSPQAPGLRRDLLARFGAEPLVLPPLRARREDVGALARHFLGRPRRLEVAAFLALCLHDWPGNVRELESVMHEAALYAGGKPEIGLADLPRAVRERVSVGAGAGRSQPVPPRRSPRARPEPREIAALLEQHHGNVAEVARALDRQWAVVWRWILKSGLDVEKYRR